MFDPITIEVEGKPLEIEVDYEVLPGQPAIIDRAPEDCQEGFEDEYIIHTVFIGNSLMPTPMLDLILDDIIDKLKEFLDADPDGL